MSLRICRVDRSRKIGTTAAVQIFGTSRKTQTLYIVPFFGTQQKPFMRSKGTLSNDNIIIEAPNESRLTVKRCNLVSIKAKNEI